jgi:hypothetical protein
MPIQSAPLNLLTFSQRWVPHPPGLEDPFLSLHVLVIPKGDPTQNFNGAATPFADANLAFEAAIVPSLAALPNPGAVSQRVPLAIAQPPNRRRLLESLGRLFKIRPQAPPGPRGPQIVVRKFLTPSYREATRFASPRTRFAVIDDSYECALRDSKPAIKPPSVPDDRVLWEEVLAFVLRQPVLAREIGLLYETRLPLPDPNPFAAGGYFFVDLSGDSAYRAEVTAQPALLARYAARIPALASITTERPIFTSVLFPTTGIGDFDEVFVEAEEYDDGFGRIVHGGQPQRAAQVDRDVEPLKPGEVAPPNDAGIRLGWDDEQVAIWHNRQFGVNAYDPGVPSPDSPLGVAGYRIDVREDKPSGDWHSLMRVTGALALEGFSFGVFDGELNAEAVPINLTFRETDGFWLPSYFTSWTGGSLVAVDPDRYRIANQPGAIPPAVYAPVDADLVKLRYGHTYQFRVRLADLTGGGPLVGDAPAQTAPAPVAKVPFRRFVPPKAVSVEAGGGVQPDGATATYTVHRPLLGYPDLLFTDFPNAVNLLLAEAPAASAASRETALPDPDATQLEIEVQARTLRNDPAAADSSYVSLYTVTRDFPAADPSTPFILNAQFEDLPQVDVLKDVVLSVGDPIRLPSARDIRLVLTPIGSPDAALDYWGSQQARRGSPVSVYLRAPSRDERKLLTQSIDGPEIQAIYLQPDPPQNPSLFAQMAMAGLRHEIPADLTSRLAGHLHLAHDGLTFSAPTGRRQVIAASHALRCNFNPDRSSITFGSKSDLTRHWIVAIRLTIDRDWTWNGLAAAAFDVKRDGAAIGQIVLPRTVNPGVGPAPDRDHTELLFLDAYDSKPSSPGLPSESHLEYALVPNFTEVPANVDVLPLWQLPLPITTAPVQTPKLASAGLALSDYSHDPHYSSIEERRRMLYFEFDRPPDDDHDAYFARVVAYGPDPMLTGDAVIPEPREGPLPIDPELIRVVTQDSSNDRAGLDAMQALIAGPDRTRYLLPLPPGLDADSSELFGFFVYEIRLGHDDTRWCTAQGRFGLPLRVAGVQHPAPQLRCSVSRTDDAVFVTAPFAAPVFDRQNIRTFPPRTTLYALLYTQVMQADGQAWRNVLLATGAAELQHRHEVHLDLRFVQGMATFPQDEILRRIRILGLPLDSTLSVVAVELLPEPNSTTRDPLVSELGDVRIYRASPLTPVPEICPPPAL